MKQAMMIKRRQLLALSALPLIGVPARAAAPLKVAFVYAGPVNGGGVSFAHDQGRRAMESALAGRVKTSFVENVADGVQAEAVLRKLVADGNRLIFTTSYGFMSATDKVAEAFPRVFFENAGGYMKTANMGNYEMRMYEGAYLLGVVAGRATRSNLLGVVASKPIPETVRNINAFTLGAQSVNRRIRTRLAWANAWHDPVRERAAAESLIAGGVDVLTHTTDSPTVLQVAQQRGKFALGWGADMARFAPRAQLTACIHDWAEYYTDAVRKFVGGAWRPREFKGGLRDGMVRLAPFNRAAPPDVAALVQERVRQLRAYEVRVFAGPLRDQDGDVRVSINANLLQREQIGMNWFVQGVEGALPR